jgi:hypothetical protein
MVFKKSKAVIAAVLCAAMAANAMVATISASAFEPRTKEEAFGDSTYAERFLSLYDDVVTKGKENGYLSSEGIPYHAVEEVIIEAPDYGHETTSEAMSYLVWIAAMHDNITKNHTDQVSKSVTASSELGTAWKTLENMIPSEQKGFWDRDSVSAQYCGEYDNPEDCATKHAADSSKTAENPIYKYFTSAYSGEKGLYLMHWLADVDNWYGYGTGTNFTFINTFQRGEQESCWETVPHPCVEELKYGMKGTRGLKGIFNLDAQVAPQYAYTNAPDAEDRAIQGVYEANKWGVEDPNVTKLAAKMGDELRNNMYDKYYQEISENTSWTNGNAGDKSAHYLMNWYTSWGGALDGTWAWQIGCSHAHEFYQNPLAAYGLITENGLKSGMLAQGAEKDYTKSLERQLEFYQWLQSSDGPIAGGATNSLHGRYDPYTTTSTFYGMMYTPHPVYADPGSNHWIGNQVWAVQRLAELYYWEKKDGNQSLVNPGGVTMDDALTTILDKWVAWFVNNTVLTEDGDFYIPSNLDWTGEPDKWSGSQSANSSLKATITGYGNTDFGCVCSLANTLIYYAKAKGVSSADIAGLTEKSVGGTYNNMVDGVSKVGTTTYAAGDADLGKVSLYLAQQLVDRVWSIGRDNIGLTRTDHNGSMARFFSQPVWVPVDYNGTMPNGDAIKNGISFLDIRSMYLDSSKCQGGKTSDEAIAKVKELQAAYEKDVAAGAKWSGGYSASSDEGKAELAKFTNVAEVEFEYHRFWHAGDVLMSLGALAELYPELTPTDSEQQPSTDDGDILYGDTDCNEKVELLDVILLNKNLLGMEQLTPKGAKNADVNIDGAVDGTDSLYILKSLVSLVTLPVKE